MVRCAPPAMVACSAFLLLCVWLVCLSSYKCLLYVCFSSRGLYAMCMSFFVRFSRQATVSCDLFFVVRVWCYVRGIFDWFSKQDTSNCDSFPFLCLLWYAYGSCLYWFGSQAAMSCNMHVLNVFVWLCVWCYVHVVFDWFSRQATISCHMCFLVFFNAVHMFLMIDCLLAGFLVWLIGWTAAEIDDLNSRSRQASATIDLSGEISTTDFNTLNNLTTNNQNLSKYT